MEQKPKTLITSQDQPSITPEQAIQLLQVQRDKGKNLLGNRPITFAAEQAWETVTREVLAQAYGSNSPNIASVLNSGSNIIVYGGNELKRENERAERMTTHVIVLGELIDFLISSSALIKSGSFSNTLETNDLAKSSNRVFLVHGHNEAVIHETARFLEKFDLNVISLREQPNSGRTIIEKFLDYSDVSFAVILLTGDDRGGAFDCPFENQEPRARQNVILELGFFLGKLGREHVCVLYQEGVEIPSDYQGVVFVPFDSYGAWRIQLAKELGAAGFEIDLNQAFRE
jgi:predicted nucleotide-binding protein